MLLRLYKTVETDKEVKKKKSMEELVSSQTRAQLKR